MKPVIVKSGMDQLGENAKRIYCRFIRPVTYGLQFRTIPHEKFLNLTIAYYMQLKISEGETISMMINEEHLKRWNLSGAKLKELAWDNTLRDSAVLFRPLDEVLAEEGMAGASECSQLYLLTNEQRSFGAVCIAYPDCLEKIAGYIGGDYYVIPSSVHECLVLPCSDDFHTADIRKMIAQINREELQEKDVLSYSLYRYFKSRNTLMIDNS